jgi:hypothetical protein
MYYIFLMLFQVHLLLLCHVLQLLLPLCLQGLLQQQMG